MPAGPTITCCLPMLICSLPCDIKPHNRHPAATVILRKSPGIVPASKFCLAGCCWAPWLSRKCPPRRILLDIGDEAEDAHEEDHRTIRTTRLRIMKMKMRMMIKDGDNQG